VLSGYGMWANAAEIMVFFDDHWWEGLPLFTSSAFAWLAYFVMGAAWMDYRTISRVWPLLGTFAGLLALNGGGSFLVLGFRDGATPLSMLTLMLFHAIWVLAAILMATWMVTSLLRSSEQRAPAAQTQS
jgi:hypothetical protein